MISGKNVLITGGAGFIGSHLCDRLLQDGLNVVCLDNLVTGSMSNLQNALQNPQFFFVKQNVQESLPRGPFHQIYNLACPASPSKYQLDPVETMRTCIIGALNVLEYGKKNGARVLQASTSEVYGDPDKSPQSEEYVGAVNCTGQRACYDEGKRAAEALFYDFHRQSGVEIRVARIFNTYGPRMKADDGRVIPNFLNQAMNGSPITVYGDGSQTRSFCYVDDLVEGLVRMMNEPGGRLGPFNLGNPVEHTVLELANIIGAKTGQKSETINTPLPDDDPKIRRPDIEKARSILGWEPKISLHHGLDRTLEWARMNPPCTEANVEYLANHMAGSRIAGSTLDVDNPPLKAMPSEDNCKVAVIGGGPAGLTAAYELQKLSDNHVPVVFEAGNIVGGISRTESHNGFRFDIGGHRFFTKVKEVEALWREILGDEFITRPRKSRIYYRDKYFDYPLKITNALGNMGLIEAARIGLSYLKWRAFPSREEENLEQWVTNRFGKRLFEHFFKTYTEKVWGIPCTEIRADWAAQRIKNLSLSKALINALTGANDTASLIEQFEYPRLGPGQMWETAAKQISERGGQINLNCRVSQIFHDNNIVTELEVLEGPWGAEKARRVKADEFISTMSLKDLVNSFEPAAPEKVLKAANQLKYRDFMIVTLVLDDPDPFDDNWIYVHSPDVQVGRIQNFRAWSPDMVPDQSKASIGMEYFCLESDPLWDTNDENLIEMAAQELELLGLGTAKSVIDGAVIRQRKAYPVYDNTYRSAVGVIREWLSTFENFNTVGRNGMHHYNNQDHSMLTAMLAVRNILGENHDTWSVNVERSYHEEFQVQNSSLPKPKVGGKNYHAQQA